MVDLKTKVSEQELALAVDSVRAAAMAMAKMWDFLSDLEAKSGVEFDGTVRQRLQCWHS